MFLLFQAGPSALLRKVRRIAAEVAGRDYYEEEHEAESPEEEIDGEEDATSEEETEMPTANPKITNAYSAFQC